MAVGSSAAVKGKRRRLAELRSGILVAGTVVAEEGMEAAEALGHTEVAGMVVVAMRRVWEVAKDIAEGCRGLLAGPDSVLKDMETATARSMPVGKLAQTSRTCS